MGLPKITCSVTIRYSACDFLPNFYRKCAFMLYRGRFRHTILRVICRKSEIFFYHRCIWLPLWDDLIGISRSPALGESLLCTSTGVVCVMIRLAVLIEHRLETDIHTQTHGHSTYRTSVASRGKKTSMAV